MISLHVDTRTGFLINDATLIYTALLAISMAPAFGGGAVANTLI
jgi:hypothetical protein